MRNLMEHGSDGRVERAIFSKVGSTVSRMASMESDLPQVSVILKFLGHWKNKSLAKAFNQWSNNLLMNFRSMVRKGSCPCNLPHRAAFKAADMPQLVILCNCETCMGRGTPPAVAVFTNSTESMAIKGIKPDDMLVKEHTEAESGKWTVKYHWQALGLSGPTSTKQIGEVEIDKDTMEAWVCEACQTHVMFTHKDTGLCCVSSGLFAEDSTLMEGTKLVQFTSTRRKIGTTCAGYIANLRASALLADMSPEARQRPEPPMEQQEAKHARVRRKRVPQLAIPPPERYPSGAAVRMKTLRLQGTGGSGAHTHRARLERGGESLRIATPPATPGLAPLRSLHSMKTGHGHIPHVQGDDSQLKIQPLYADKEGVMRPRLPEEGRGGSGAQTERRWGDSNRLDLGVDGVVGGGGTSAGMPSKRGDRLPCHGQTPLSHMFKPLNWKEQWLLDIEGRKYHEPVKEKEDLHGPRAPWCGRTYKGKTTFGDCKLATRNLLERACADANMVMAANGTAVEKELFRLASLPINARKPLTSEEPNKARRNPTGSVFGGAHLKALGKFKKLVAAKKQVDYVVVAGNCSYEEVKGGMRLLQQAKRQAENARLAVARMASPVTGGRAGDYSWIMETPWVGKFEENMRMGGTNPVDIGLDAPW